MRTLMKKTLGRVIIFLQRSVDHCTMSNLNVKLLLVRGAGCCYIAVLFRSYKWW